jgi:hypothetical protein
MSMKSMSGGKSDGFSGVRNVHAGKDSKKGSGGSDGTSGFKWNEGGNTHMYGRSSAGPMPAGQTANNHPGPGSNKEFAGGGHKNHMFNRMGAEPMPAGETGRNTAGRGANFAQGGSTHMFGRRGSIKRSPGETGGM